jgi:hypothetical protein
MSDDPIEYAGTDQTIKADPVPAPAPDAAPVNKSHPKIAKLRPKRELAKAQKELDDARLELRAATAALRSAEIAEGNAVADWITLNPTPSALEVNRERLAKENAARVQRVGEGLQAYVQHVQKVGNSPLDQFAAVRGRAAAHNGVLLRSNVTRRTI